MLGALALGAAVLLRGVFAAMDAASEGRRARGVGVIGSKAFTESIILGEILAQWLERRAGVTVERRFRLGGTHICLEALRQGDIDVYPEYTGTGLMAILDRAAMGDPSRVLGVEREEFARRYGLVWLEPVGL